MSQAARRVHDASVGLSGSLRVGYLRGYERSDLSVLMQRFHQQNSNVLITFYRCSTDVLAAGLLHHVYDIIFTWDSTNLKQQEGIDFLVVQKAKLVVALYAGHPFAQRRQLFARILQDADARAVLRARLTADPNRLLALPYRLGVFLHSAWLLAAYTQLKNRFL